MKIAVIGHVCIDQNTSEHASYESWGSAVMYIETYLRRRSDCELTVIAPYGKDFLKYVADMNILPAAKGEDTLLFKNVSSQGNRVQHCEHVESAVPPELSGPLRQAIAEADIIIVAPLLPNFARDYVNDLLSVKKETCLTALLPQGYFRGVNGTSIEARAFSEASKLLPLFDIVIFSEDDLQGGLDSIQTWAEQNPSSNLIMTQGEKGASWILPTEIISVATDPVREDQIIDSVGCGDIFSAAAIYEYFSSKNVKAAIKAGNKAAGIKLLQATPVI